MQRLFGAFIALTLVGNAQATGAQAQVARNTLVVGIDVSGSFRSRNRYNDAVEFAANYLYAHIHGLGGLTTPTAVFVGSIGGERPDEAKSFQPIDTFRGMSVAEIAAFLRRKYPVKDGLTDFNPFFQRVAFLIKRQSLILAPLNVVLFTDGVPDLASGARPRNPNDLYAKIDVGPLEYLSHNVTVRLLYPTPTVAVSWEKKVVRRRVRMWTVDNEVMQTWHRQLKEGASPQQQQDLWKWIGNNVDFRVRGGGMM